MCFLNQWTPKRLVCRCCINFQDLLDVCPFHANFSFFFFSYAMQLPDYHEVIDNPMDFGTVKKKLTSVAYTNLEQFEVSLHRLHLL